MVEVQAAAAVASQHADKEGLAQEQDDELESLNTIDRELLDILGTDATTEFAFQGLKRKSGLHQETLSRALHRLEREGLVQKMEDGGYRLSTRGQILTKNGQGEPEYLIPVLTTQLPPDIETPELVESIRGKWFGRLRWYGLNETKDGFELIWVADDGSVRLVAKFAHTYLSIRSNARTPREKAMSVQLAYDLFSNIAKVYRAKSLLGQKMFLSS